MADDTDPQPPAQPGVPGVAGFDRGPERDPERIKVLDMAEHAFVVVVNEDGTTLVYGGKYPPATVMRYLRLLADRMASAPAPGTPE